MEKKANPVLVEVVRGNVVETRHRGSVAIISSEGEVLASYGDIDEAVFIRSAAKPMQEIPLIVSGAADFFNITEKELAVGCSSHYGEDFQEETIANWLTRVGLSEDLLECGPPNYDTNFDVLIRRGITEYRPIHNNCSGKHTNFLTVSKFLGFPLKNYIELDHPIQQLVKKTLGEMTEADMDKAEVATEGCGVPAFAFTRREVARAYAKFAKPEVLDDKKAAACRKIIKAMMKYPDYYGGNKCFDSTSTAVLKGVVCKQGNRGTEIAMVPALGLGVAIKLEDGLTFAKECAMCHIIDFAFGLMDDDQRAKLKRFMSPDIYNARQEVVGGTRANKEWLESLKEIRSKVKFDPDWYDKL
ncbi:MAG: asparaginase [Alphaproteobacteria bacterium]